MGKRSAAVARSTASDASHTTPAPTTNATAKLTMYRNRSIVTRRWPWSTKLGSQIPRQCGDGGKEQHGLDPTERRAAKGAARQRADLGAQSTADEKRDGERELDVSP